MLRSLTVRVVSATPKFLQIYSIKIDCAMCFPCVCGWCNAAFKERALDRSSSLRRSRGTRSTRTMQGPLYDEDAYLPWRTADARSQGANRLTTPKEILDRHEFHCRSQTGSHRH